MSVQTLHAANPIYFLHLSYVSEPNSDFTRLWSLLDHCCEPTLGIYRNTSPQYHWNRWGRVRSRYRFNC
jgi:hypothetical protein